MSKKKSINRYDFNNTYQEKWKPDYKYKLLLLGDSGVGKTNFMIRYVDNEFQESFISTIGIDNKIKNIRKNNENIRVKVWDTAGQERFRVICKNYYKKSDGILIIYDVTCKETFRNIPGWMEQIHDGCPENAKIILIANKIDLKDKRVVNTEDGEELAKKFKCQYIECSAKNDINIKESFQNLIDEIYDSGIVKRITEDDEQLIVPDEQPNPEKNKKCCK
jgi:small GTP-binding protein